MYPVSMSMSTTVSPSTVSVNGEVVNTSEVGQIRIPDYKSKGKINKRFYVELEP